MASIPLLRLSRPNHSAVRFNPPQFRPKPTATRCSHTPTPAKDRLITAASYFIPFFTGLQYGPHLWVKYPRLYYSVPYASTVSFLGLYCVVKNRSFSRSARSNALQALVLDVLLWLPVLLRRIIHSGRSGALAYSGLLLVVVSCFVYWLVSTLLR